MIYNLFQEHEFLLYIPGIAKYRVINGKEIIISPCKNASKESVRLFLLSITMAALLTQRKKILLHASAILSKQKLILFIGNSGAGKSSIAAEFSKRGFTLFSDDVCVLEDTHASSSKVFSYASYPMMKLWEDTVMALDDQKFDKNHKIIPQLTKYGQFFHDQFTTTAYPIEKIFILNPVENTFDNYSSKKISGIEAFELLSKNTYRRQFLLKSTLQEIHLKQLSFLVQSADISILTRNIKESNIQSFANFVEHLLH
jgi:energy-coupling factor transporter ATP-binding protein EcfA2